MNGPKYSIPTEATDSLDSSAADMDRRLAEAIVEYETLIRSGARPELQHFLERYKELQPALRECIEAFGFVNQAVAKQPLLTSEQTLAQTILGDFQILRKVGAGGMGVVYEAHQLSLARRVALKVMASSQAGDERSLKRFQSEAQAAATLQHPHIVPVFSTGQVERTYYYAMQFIDGLSVADLLVHFRSQAHIVANRQFSGVHQNRAEASTDHIDADAATVVNNQSSEETYRDGRKPKRGIESHLWYNLIPQSEDYFRAVTRVTQQAAEALQHAHENGILHRDIKPSNLLIDVKGNLWVADFGLARLPNSNLTAPADVLGTVRYMSPEQASGQVVALDGRTDVYSLGATLYELLTLKPVFESDDRCKIMRQVLETDPVSPKVHCKSLPQDLETIVLTALSKDVALRYRTAADFAEDLNRFLNCRPILAKPPTIKRILLKFLSRHRAAVVGLSILVLVLLIIGIIATSIALSRISWANQRAENANTMLSAAVAEKDVALYRANMILARRDWDVGSFQGTQARLNRTAEQNRLWEWHYFNAICQTPVKSFEISPPAEYPCSIDQNGSVVLGYFPLRNERYLSIQSVPNWDGTNSKLMRFKPRDRGFEFHNGQGYALSENGKFAAALEASKQVAVIKTDSGDLLHFVSAPYPIRGALWVENDGNVLAPLIVEDKLEVWDLGRNLRLSTLDDKTSVRSWSADSTRIYQDSGTIRESRTGRKIAGLSPQLRDALLGGICRFSPDGNLLAGGAKNGIRIINANNGLEIFHFAEGNIGFMTAFSPDGTRLATAGVDRSLWIYDLLSGKCVLHSYVNSPGMLLLAFQEDGNTLVTATATEQQLWNCLDVVEGDVCSIMRPAATLDAYEVIGENSYEGKRILESVDIRDNSILRSYKLPLEKVLDFAVCPKTKVVALRTASKIELWGLESQQRQVEILNTEAVMMQFSDDGHWLAIKTSGGSNASVLFDVTKGVVDKTFENAGASATCFQFTRDSTLLFVGYQSGEVVAWDTKSGSKKWMSTPHRQSITAMAVDPTNKYVLSAGEDEIIRVLDLRSGKSLHSLKGHTDRISAFAFHPTQPRLASAGADTVIRLWDTLTWEPIFQLPSHGVCKRLEFSSNGDSLLSFQNDSVIRFAAEPTRDRDTQRRDWLERSLARAEKYQSWYAANWFAKELLKLDPQNIHLLSRLETLNQHIGQKPPDKLPRRRMGMLDSNMIEYTSLNRMEAAYVFAANQAILRNKVNVKQVADRIVGQLDEDSSGWTASLAYRLYLFHPGNPVEIEAMLPAFEKQTLGYKSKFAFHFVRGGLEYRAEKYDRALESLLLAETLELDSESHALNWLLLSLVNAHSGNLSVAKDWLERAKLWRSALSVTEYANLDFQVRIPFPILMIEAEDTLRAKTAISDQEEEKQQK